MGSFASCLCVRRAHVQGQRVVQTNGHVQGQSVVQTNGHVQGQRVVQTNVQDDTNNGKTGNEAERVDVQNGAGVEDQTVDIQEEGATADQSSVEEEGGTADQSYVQEGATADQSSVQEGATADLQAGGVEDEKGYIQDLPSSSSAIRIPRSRYSNVCLWSPESSCPSSSDSRTQTDSFILLTEHLKRKRLYEASFLLMTELERKRLYEFSSYWIYARTLDDHEVQSFHAIDVQQYRHAHSYVPIPPYPLDELADSATAVLGKKLYVIGGRKDSFVCSDVYVYDPAMYKWSGLAPTIIPREGAVAATADGRIYIFGGCSNQTDPWAEMYEPSTNIWTPIPRSQTLIDALQIGFDPLLRSIVWGNKIFIRGAAKGIVFDVTSSAWSLFPRNLFNYWWNGACTAAVVQNMLITCHCQFREDRLVYEMSIQAYDPDIDAWFKLEGLDSFVHTDAYRSYFMAVNGMLVLYHMWDDDYLRFSVIEINEKLQTGLAVNVLWRCWVPRFKNIERILAIPAHSFSA